MVDPTQIRDLQGNHIENGRLGRFHVRIQPDPSPGVIVSAAMNANGEWEATLEIISEPGNQVVITNWDFSCIQFGHSIIKLAEAEIQPTGGPVEPLAHVYNLGTLAPGYYVFVFKTNLAHCGSAGFRVPGTEGDPIDNWQVRVGAAAQSDESDGDGDGMNVVAEYFFVTDPNRMDLADVSAELVTDEQGRRHFGLRFRRLHGAEGIIQIIDGTVEVLVCLRDTLEESPYHFLRVAAIRDQN